jgi:hypothetical protein
MRSLTFFLLIVATFVASPVKSDPGTRLSIDAQAALVVVKPLPEGRRLIRLPALEFAMTIEPQCATNMQAESISISIADTRKTLGAADIDGQSNVATSITIPRQQVAPLAIDGFCQAGENSSTESDLQVMDAFTAHISLRCTGEDTQTIVYVSQPLALSLRCEATYSDAETPATQESSPVSIAR